MPLPDHTKLAVHQEAYRLAYGNGFRLKKKAHRDAYMLLDRVTREVVAGEGFAFRAQDVIEFISSPPLEHHELHTDLRDYED
jgi:hypothetical protein